MAIFIKWTLEIARLNDHWMNECVCVCVFNSSCFKLLLLLLEMMMSMAPSFVSVPFCLNYLLPSFKAKRRMICYGASA